MPNQSNLVLGFGLLLGFQFGGEVIAHLFAIPIPGSIVGLLLLFVGLKACKSSALVESVEATPLEQVATPLLRNLAVLFVPSGVGIMEFEDVFEAHSLTLILVVIASTLLTMAATALAFVAARSIAARLRRRQQLTGRRLLTVRSIATCETKEL